MNIIIKKTTAMLIHTLTASGAIVGLWAVHAIYHHNLRLALYLIITTIIIDSIDGPLSRYFSVSTTTPNIDGALLDNIVDFFTWSLVPVFLLIQIPIANQTITFFLSASVILASGYQFCCKDAKIEGNYFKRFPSDWSAVITVLYLLPWPDLTKVLMIILGVVFSFIPIYIPKPTTYIQFTQNKLFDLALNIVNYAVQILSLLFVLIALAIFPEKNTAANYALSLAFAAYISLWLLSTAIYYFQSKQNERS